MYLGFPLENRKTEVELWRERRGVGERDEYGRNREGLRQMMAVECEVCVNYQGRTNCATAAGADEMEAARSAQSTACAPIAGGMSDSIACDRATPEKRVCRVR